MKNATYLKSFAKRIKTITPLEAFILISVAAFVIFVVKYFHIQETWLTVRIDVHGKEWIDDFTSGSAYQPPTWLLNNVKPGDTEKSLSGKTIATVLQAQSYGDKTPAASIIARINVIGNSQTHQYSFKGRNIQKGGTIELVLPQTKVVGQITDMSAPERGYPVKALIATVRVRNIEPWLVDKISINDAMVNKTNNHIVAQVLSKTTEDPVSVVFFNNPGFFTPLFLEKNPRLKDAIITLKVEVELLPDGKRFAGNQLLKIAAPLKLSFPDYELPFAELQEFHDETKS